MTVQVLDVNRSGFATYTCDNRQFKYRMALSTTMIREANEGFKGSLGEAKFSTHIAPTILKFHNHKNQ